MRRLQYPSERSGASLRDVVESLFRQRRILLWATLITFLAGMALAFLPHKKYASQMVLLVQNSRSNNVITAGRTNGDPVGGEVSDPQLNSEVEVLSSNDVLDEVVDPGWRSIPATSRPADQLRKHEAEVSSLRSHLDIAPGRKSHTITIQLTSRDPRQATATLNKLLTAFLSKQRELGHPARASKFFADEADRYKREWEDAQHRLADYQQQQKMVSLTDKETLTEHQLFDADTQLRAADVQLAELTHRIEGEQAQLASVPRRTATGETSAPMGAAIDQLNLQMVQLNLKRTELLTKYRPEDRLVQEVDQQISQTRAALQNIGTMSTSATSTNVNPTWQQADQNLSADRSALKAMRARRDGLAAQVADLQSKLNHAEGQTVDFNTLQSKVTELEANYVLYSQKREESLINDSMDAQEMLNVAVVEQPTYSLGAIRPRPMLDTLLAAFTALFIGGFSVFAVETARETVATAHELEGTSAYPVLATVPFGRAIASGGSAIVAPAKFSPPGR